MFGTGLGNLGGSFANMRGLDPEVIAALLQMRNKYAPQGRVVGGTTGLGALGGLGKGLSMGVGGKWGNRLPLLASLPGLGTGFSGGTALSGLAPVLASLALTKYGR